MCEKELIVFIKFQYEALRDNKEVCKKEDCCKIEEMLCHILYGEE